MQSSVAVDLRNHFQAMPERPSSDKVATFIVEPEHLHSVLTYLKKDAEPRFNMLFDLSAIDESGRGGGYTVFYQLMAVPANQDIRIKVKIPHHHPVIPSVCSIWPAANWYEREVFDMFGIKVEDHPHLRRILMPSYWQGHPLRKEHPSRATEMTPYSIDENTYPELLQTYEAKAIAGNGNVSPMVLNIGPTHPGTHGLLRFIVYLEGEQILDIDPDIGFHHRGAEKIAERNTYHTYIPYTDRIDYLAGVQNELPYILAVEQLAGISAPHRAQMIRVLLCELFRISSHLVWIAGFAHDTGAMAPPFYAFRDREYLFDIVESFTGGRMHPAFFRIGGVALDLPEAWRDELTGLIKRLRNSLGEYQTLLTRNPIFRARTEGVGVLTAEQAIDWGVSGPNLRACGVNWDLRKLRPYSGYENFDFEVPTTSAGDALARAQVRMIEIEQSLRIVEQAMTMMPEGPVLAADACFGPPRKDRTLEDIDTLIHHFISVSHGLPVPAGESSFICEAPKGMNSYFVVSDGSAHPYRVRIRTPSFAHVQVLPEMVRGGMLADLIAVIGSIDYILADLDR